MEPLPLPFDVAVPLSATATGRLGLTHAQADVLEHAALSYARNAKSANTQRLYRTCWGAFETWCTGRGVSAMPATPEVLALYISHLANTGRKVASIDVALSAVSQAHEAMGYPSPRKTATVRTVWQGIRRSLGCAQVQKNALSISELRRLIGATATDDKRGLIGVRDRALILVGFAGALRRSELAALEVEDVTEEEAGLRVHLRRSKIDQEARGREIGIPYGGDPSTCPVRTLRAWKAASGIVSGTLFVGITRHGRLTGKPLAGKDVARIVKRTATVAGLDASKLAGHSLRAGLVTAAVKAGKSEHAIMQHTGHTSVQMVRKYVRSGKLFEDHPAFGIGL